jgi:phage repressor protein C with HTH and peptisase S24 domain
MDVREALQKLIDERNEDYASLSRLLGRNAAYMQQFIKRGVPRRLAEDDRRLLARYFGVSEELLGGPPRDQRLRDDDMLPVPRLEVSAAAGAGAINEQERAKSHFAFDVKWLRTVAAGDIQRLSVIQVKGDSMAPTLADGDEILVDGSDGQERLRDGIYVLRADDALVVKRIALNPVTRRISIKSDNEAYPSWPECELGAVDVVGRVVWAARRIV